MRKLLNTLYIMSSDSYLRLDGENVVVTRSDNNVPVRIPLHNLEGIVCFNYQGISPALMGKCVDLGIDVSFLTPEGRFLARVNGIPNGNVLLRRQQYKIAEVSDKKVEFARLFVLGKVYNNRWILERMCRDHSDYLEIQKIKDESIYLKNSFTLIKNAKDNKELMGFEGDLAKHYFSVFNHLILQNSDFFIFNSRTRRPPMDAVNALLSFAYSILAKDCVAALSSVGLDPYVGFLHADRPGRVSLALDLEEELRGPVADRFVLSLINLRKISKNHFDFKENGAVYLNEKGRKIFLNEWQNRNKEKIRHPFLKESMEWGLVPFSQALLLARTIRGDLDIYPPFLWK